MKTKINIKLPLSDFERANLKKNKVKISEIHNYAIDELEILFDTTWDFTEERKKSRLKNGYPINRPKKAWNETK